MRPCSSVLNFQYGNGTAAGSLSPVRLIVFDGFVVGKTAGVVLIPTRPATTSAPCQQISDVLQPPDSTDEAFPSVHYVGFHTATVSRKVGKYFKKKKKMGGLVIGFKTN